MLLLRVALLAVVARRTSGRGRGRQVAAGRSRVGHGCRAEERRWETGRDGSCTILYFLHCRLGARATQKT